MSCIGSAAASIDVWFLHAFADSQDCYKEVVTTPLAKRARIFLFDLPGHGASAARPTGLTIEHAAHIWAELLQVHSRSRPVVLVGHSMSSIIATRTAQLLDRMPKLVVSVEGNLTRADAYFTGQAGSFENPDRFHKHFHEQIVDLARAMAI